MLSPTERPSDSARLVLVDGPQAAAYLLAVFLEDGIAASGRVGTVQVVPDVAERLFPAPGFGLWSLHGRLYSVRSPGRRVTGLGDKQIDNIA